MDNAVTVVAVSISNFIENIKGCKAFIKHEIKGKLYYVEYT